MRSPRRKLGPKPWKRVCEAARTRVDSHPYWEPTCACQAGRTAFACSRTPCRAKRRQGAVQRDAELQAMELVPTA